MDSIHSASMGPRFFKRGEYGLKTLDGFGEGASMGPRFFKRGEVANSGYEERHYLGFNGATLLQAWRAERQFPHINGSQNASMGPRFFKRGEKTITSVDARALIASMGPRFFKRGEWSADGWRVIHVVASMGPRFFKRGEEKGQKGRIDQDWLQWGHASSSVESQVQMPAGFPAMELQWGHASSSVESAHPRTRTASAE